jgi:type IV secretion system protein VirB5
LGQQPKVVPHIIEVDGLGEAHYRGATGVSGSEFTPGEALIRSQLRRFIDLSRTISSDPVLLRKNWIEAYRMLSVAGNTRMTEWVRVNNPFDRAQTATTGIEVLSAVPVSAESWQIDWKETTWDRQGEVLGKPVVWRAMLKVVIDPPATREQMLANPLGLFVDEFHWDRVQAVKP